MAQFRLAMIQTVPRGALALNLDQAQGLIAQAVAEGAELLVLPENFAYGGCRDIASAGMAETTLTGPGRAFIAEQARSHGVWIVGGTIPVSDPAVDDPRPAAACFVVNHRGAEVGRYDKIHLFDVEVGDGHGSYHESRDYRPGSEPVTVNSPFGCLGLSVCYDVRFPELYRRLADAGAQILLVPSAFTATTGRAHWELLLRARAVENLCFVAGANLGDRKHPRKATWGGSAIIDPWGDTLASLEDGPGVAVADIDTTRIDELRARMPVHAHRRIWSLRE